MATPGELPLKFTPRGVCDTIDGDNSPPGACTSLQNLIFDQGTPGLLVCRPAAQSKVNFGVSGLSGMPGVPGVTSIEYQVDDIIYGMVGITSEPYAYVTNFSSNDVSVINTLTNAVVTTIPVGSNPVGVAVTPDGSQVWVCNNGGSTVSVISTATLAVIATITVGSGPIGICFTPDGTKAYVANGNAGTVSIVTVSTRAVAAPVTVGTSPQAICITPDGLKVYAVNGISGTVSIITVASGSVTHTSTVGNGPFGAAPTPDSAHVYVTNSGDNTVSVIQTSDGSVPTTIAVGSSPEGVVITPDGAHAYVTNDGTTTVSVIATGSNTVTATVTVGANPGYPAVTPDGLHVYVPNSGGTTISVISTVSNTVTATITGGTFPESAAILSSDFNGRDYPFAYNTTTSAFDPITGITAASLPLSLPTSGDWVPPQFTLTGVDLVLVHTGFSGMTYYFGWLDITTPSTPVWHAGNTSTHGLPSVPQAAQQFNNRTYFFCGNIGFYTDTLAIAMTNADQSFTIGDLTPITCAAPLPVGTTSQGIVQGILAYKANNITLVTGDVVTQNLATNLLSPSVGTTAPRSVVSTPEGVRFMAGDGIRNISFYGVVSEPDPDLAIPFIYVLHPSRACAAYNSDIYRICLQNGKAAGSPYEDYWYSLKRHGWTGPHNFRYDCAVPLDNDFSLVSNALPAQIWESDVVQGHLGGGSSFVENGAQLTWMYETSPMTDLNNMYANCLLRSTLEMALPATGGQITFSAQAANTGVLSQGAIQLPSQGSTWGSFVWGAGTWGVATAGLVPYQIPWISAIVFNQVQTRATGNSALNLALGSWHLAYKRLKYMLQ